MGGAAHPHSTLTHQLPGLPMSARVSAADRPATAMHRRATSTDGGRMHLRRAAGCRTVRLRGNMDRTTASSAFSRGRQTAPCLGRRLLYAAAPLELLGRRCNRAPPFGRRTLPDGAALRLDLLAPLLRLDLLTPLLSCSPLLYCATLRLRALPLLGGLRLLIPARFLEMRRLPLDGLALGRWLLLLLRSALLNWLGLSRPVRHGGVRRIASEPPVLAPTQWLQLRHASSRCDRVARFTQILLSRNAPVSQLVRADLDRAGNGRRGSGKEQRARVECMQGMPDGRCNGVGRYAGIHREMPVAQQHRLIHDDGLPQQGRVLCER
jgi:hypothetical protein